MIWNKRSRYQLVYILGLPKLVEDCMSNMRRLPVEVDREYSYTCRICMGESLLRQLRVPAVRLYICLGQHFTL